MTSTGISPIPLRRRSPASTAGPSRSRRSAPSRVRRRRKTWACKVDIPNQAFSPGEEQVISTSPQQHVTRRAFAGTLAVMATALAWPVSAQTPAASPEPTEAPRFFIHPLDETAQGYPDLTLEPGESATLNV